MAQGIIIIIIFNYALKP